MRLHPDLVYKVSYIKGLFLCLCLILFEAGAVYSSILYKEYIIVPSGNKDYLCVNHVVQQGDNLYKIIMQRGNLQLSDFFLLKQLNPQIRNFNIIKPGYNILIPLKEIRKGEFRGQSSGKILIPFVTRKSVKKLLDDNSVSYKIHSGDTVSKLIFKSIGVKFKSKDYDKSIKLFRYLNPEIKNINIIVRGQEIQLPRSDLINKEWFASLFNPDVEKRLLNKPKPVKFAVQKHKSKIDERFLKAISRTLDGDLQLDGELYLPVSGNNIMNIRLSRTPLIQSENFPSIFFLGNGRINKKTRKILSNFYKKVLYFNSNYADEQSNFYREQSFVFDHGIEAYVKFKKKYREKGDSDSSYEILTPGGYYSEPVEFLSLFTEKHAVLPSSGESSQKLVISFIPYSTSERFCEEVLQKTSSRFIKNAPISFPYKGIQIKASTNIAKNLKDDLLIVDFGRFYGDTINELKNIHMNVVRISGSESKYDIVEKLARGLQYDVIKDPVFPEAVGRKDSEERIRIKVPGLLVINHYSKQDRYVFFTELDSSKFPYPVLYYLGWLNVSTVFI